MEKLKSILKWVGTDGLLHFLVCYALMLTLSPVVGVWWTLLAVAVAAFAKEAQDYFIQKDNDLHAVLHDLICDGAGVLVSLLTFAVWMLCN